MLDFENFNKFGDESIKEILSYHDLISAIVFALEQRDQYTARHSERVAEMTENICKIMGLSIEQEVVYHIAAHLHDIGKIGIRDDSLITNTKLTNEQYEEIKKHSLIGFSILDKIFTFHDIALIVRGHHERYDGLGYPDKKRGEDILLGSRIIAIADSIDAMLSDRSYRKKMDVSTCKKEILVNKGKMYDPTIASLVLGSWNKIVTIDY